MVENELVGLSLDDEEEEILRVQRDPIAATEVYEFCLVGCFLTASIVHFSVMRSTVVHDVPLRFFNDAMARQLGDFLGKFLKYDGSSFGKGMRSYLHIRVQLDVSHPLKRKKKVMFSSGSYSYVTFKYERLTLFCFFYGKLGHNDLFYQAKMAMEFEVAEFGWDMSLKAQCRGSLTMNSLWLCDECKGMNEGNMFGSNNPNWYIGGGGGRGESGSRIDPMLGVNFEGDFNLPLSLERDSSKFQGQVDIEHDFEDCGIEVGDGEKRPRREVVSPNSSKKLGTLLGREMRVRTSSSFIGGYQMASQPVQ
ncbi:hypothetical protein PVK06_011743 [Gossypium arboreum]|uniref:Zinc knuckle CX2CX4HX4C domain-containing protein n=1 Tax=Gossypium arboreum TaxID=29729 RepID=A0ABR0Q9Q3_GOSAR|nr:hypothetical protein PVK06_011743 [Gossypium arboreum]